MRSPPICATYFALQVLRVVLPVDLARRGLILDAERRVSHLRGQPVLEVEQTRLAHVLDLRARLANNRGFEAHARSRIPTEDRERSCTSPTGTAVLLLRLQSV